MGTKTQQDYDREAKFFLAKLGGGLLAAVALIVAISFWTDDTPDQPWRDDPAYQAQVEAPETPVSSVDESAASSALPMLRDWNSSDPQWTAFLADVQSLDGPDRLSDDGLIGTAQGTCMTLDMGMTEQEAVHLLQVDDDPWSDGTARAWVSSARSYLC